MKLNKQFRDAVNAANDSLGSYTNLEGDVYDYADQHFASHIGYYRKNKDWTFGKVLCMECYHEYSINGITVDYENIDGTATGFINCPHCGKLIKLVPGRKRTMNEIQWCNFLDEVNGIPVLRVFERFDYRNANLHPIQCSNEPNTQPDYVPERLRWCEVMRRWYGPDGMVVNTSRGLVSFPYARRSPWASNEIKYRRREHGSNGYYAELNYAADDNLVPIAPKGSKLRYVIKIAQQIKMSSDKISWDEIFYAVINHPYIETLWKIGQCKMVIELINKISKDMEFDFKPVVTAIRVAVRHGYKPISSDYCDNYIDYVRECAELGYDIHNPHYVCPSDLSAAHQRTSKLIHKRLEQIKLTERRKRDLKDMKKYLQTHGCFLAIKFVSEDFSFHVLQDIEEFRDEGQHMHHCVYSCSYYNKPDVIILSCRDKEGNRVSTIEFDTRTMKIIQNRGVCNSRPEAYDEINRIINANIPMITAAREEQKKRTAAAANAKTEVNNQHNNAVAV